MAKLIVKLGPKVMKELFINKPSIKLGRLEDNDIVLEDNLSSRHHCEIIQRDNKYILNDLKSANGTMVNKKKISSYTLQENDEIEIGSYIIVFNEGSSFTVPGSGGSPFGATTRTAAPGAPPMPASEIVKRVTDIDASYQINIKDIFDKGESLSASAMAGMEEGKAGKKFFLLDADGNLVGNGRHQVQVVIGERMGPH